jgi:hypothetical protein
MEAMNVQPAIKNTDSPIILMALENEAGLVVPIHGSRLAPKWDEVG